MQRLLFLYCGSYKLWHSLTKHWKPKKLHRVNPAVAPYLEVRVRFSWGGRVRDLCVFSPFKSRVQPWKNTRNDLTATRHGTPLLNQPIVDPTLYFRRNAAAVCVYFPAGLQRSRGVRSHTGSPITRDNNPPFRWRFQASAANCYHAAAS